MSHSTSSFSNINMVCYASLIYIQSKLFVWSFPFFFFYFSFFFPFFLFFPFPPLHLEYLSFALDIQELTMHPFCFSTPYCYAVTKWGTAKSRYLYSTTYLWPSNKALSCVMYPSGVTQHHCLPASFLSLSLHPVSQNPGRENQEEGACIPLDMWRNMFIVFHYLFYFYFFSQLEVKCMLWRLANNTALLCIN